GVLPGLSIDDVELMEGDTGTTDAVFTVTLSQASNQTVTVDFATTDGTADAASGDYVAASGTLTIPAGTTAQTISITVNGDTTVEPDETFFVDLSNAVGANIENGRGTAVIVNDDGGGLPSLSIDDVRAAEGNSGTVEFVFTVSLSTAGTQPVTVDF